MNLLDCSWEGPVGPDGSYTTTCNAQQGLVILHPDLLLSGGSRGVGQALA